MNEELKNSIKETRSLTDELDKEANKLAVVKEEVFDMKIDILSSAFSMLMKKMTDSIDDWLKLTTEKDQYNQEFGNALKASVEKLLIEIAKPSEFKPHINPQINIDLSPIQGIISEIASQNNAIVRLLDKISLDGKGHESLYKLITLMVERQNVILETLGNKDTDLIERIVQSLEKQKAKELIAVRGQGNMIEKIKIIY